MRPVRIVRLDNATDDIVCLDNVDAIFAEQTGDRTTFGRELQR